MRWGADARLYRVATVAVARRLRSSYCALAHGELLPAELSDESPVRTIVGRDQNWDDLDPVDAEVARFADRVVADAPSMTADDLIELRDLVFDDARIFDVVVRSGPQLLQYGPRRHRTLPDAGIAAGLNPDTRAAPTVGRPIATE